MFYKNIWIGKVKNRTIGLFEIHSSSSDMKKGDAPDGYSVRFKTHDITYKSFKSSFYESYNFEDKHYGTSYWDFTTKEQAEKKRRQLQSKNTSQT